MGRTLTSILALVAVLRTSPAVAVDLHRLWDDGCARCHGHAAAFARDGMTRTEAGALASFLARHRGGQEPGVAAALADMLLAQARSDPEFRERCAVCHPQAADLARQSLIARDGMLYGRYSGRRIDDFLLGHGRLAAEEVPRFVATLVRVEREVHHPAAP